MNIFGRIESFCVRLETYTNVPLTPAMTNKMVQITVEILDILATATKEMKQSRASEFDLSLTFLEANINLEKFVKRVMGWTKLEDGLKMLDKLTDEEVALAGAHLLRVTHNIDNNVMRVEEDVRRVDENVLVVKSGIELVKDNVQAVDDKVQTMADGTQPRVIGVISDFYHPDGKAAADEVKVVVQQTADEVDDVKRS